MRKIQVNIYRPQARGETFSKLSKTEYIYIYVRIYIRIKEAIKWMWNAFNNIKGYI